MGTTSNFGWPTPEATDLVKNGWEAIKDLGDAIDTSATSFANKVVQIVQGTTTTQVSLSSATFTDTTLTATITPTSASNKILVLIQQSNIYINNSNVNASTTFKLFRDATEIGLQSFGFNNSTALAFGGLGWSYLDSPATTSATTYKTQYSALSSLGPIFVQYSGAQSNIILIEVIP